MIVCTVSALGARRLAERLVGRWLVLVVFGVVLLESNTAGVSPANAFLDERSPQPGEAHFDFTFPNIDDHQPVSLHYFRGKKVLLIQFASW